MFKGYYGQPREHMRLKQTKLKETAEAMKGNRDLGSICIATIRMLIFLKADG